MWRVLNFKPSAAHVRTLTLNSKSRGLPIARVFTQDSPSQVPATKGGFEM